MAGRLPLAVEELRAYPTQIMPNDGVGIYLYLLEKILNGL